MDRVRAAFDGLAGCAHRSACTQDRVPAAHDSDRGTSAGTATPVAGRADRGRRMGRWRLRCGCGRHVANHGPGHGDGSGRRTRRHGGAAGEPRGAYRRLGLRVETAAPSPVLIELQRAIAQATPRMLIDDLQLRAPTGASHTASEPATRPSPSSRFAKRRGGGANEPPGCIGCPGPRTCWDHRVGGQRYSPSGGVHVAASARRTEGIARVRADRRPRQWVATALARPLFSPDRRPSSVAATVATAGPSGLPV